MAHKDYSGTPLWKKLGIKAGNRLFIGSAPYPPVGADIRSLIELEDVTVVRRDPKDLDVVLFFTTSRSKLQQAFRGFPRALKPDGGFWVAWPKKASRRGAELKNDLTFETVQQIGLDAGMVDNKSCSIDADWQALRFVVRKEDRGNWPAALRGPAAG